MQRAPEQAEDRARRQRHDRRARQRQRGDRDVDREEGERSLPRMRVIERDDLGLLRLEVRQAEVLPEVEGEKYHDRGGNRDQQDQSGSRHFAGHLSPRMADEVWPGTPDPVGLPAPVRRLLVAADERSEQTLQLLRATIAGIDGVVILRHPLAQAHAELQS